MKTFGWICVVIAVLNFIAMIVSAANDAPEEAIGRFVSSIMMFGVLGGAFIYLGNKKKKEQQDHDEWKNS